MSTRIAVPSRSGRAEVVLIMMAQLSCALNLMLWAQTGAAADSYRAQDAGAAIRTIKEIEARQFEEESASPAVASAGSISRRQLLTASGFDDAVAQNELVIENYQRSLAIVLLCRIVLVLSGASSFAPIWYPAFRRHRIRRAAKTERNKMSLGESSRINLQAAEYLGADCGYIVGGLIRSAVRALEAPDLQERWLEEWASDLLQIRCGWRRICWAIGVRLLAPRQLRQVNQGFVGDAKQR